MVPVITATIIKVLFAEMYVTVVFVIRCLYTAVTLTLVKEQRFIRIIYHYLFIIISFWSPQGCAEATKRRELRDPVASVQKGVRESR